MSYPNFVCPECDGHGGWDVRASWIECTVCEGSGEIMAAEYALADDEEDDF